MPSFLTSSVTPAQQSESGSIFATGMQIGATSQGLYEKQKFDAAQQDLADKAATALQASKEEAENERAKATTIANASKELLTKTVELADKQRATLSDAMKNADTRPQALDAAAALQSHDKQTGDILRQYGIASGLDVSGIKNVGMVTNPSNLYSNAAVPSQLAYDVTKTGQQGAIAKSKDEVLKYGDDQKTAKKYGFTSVGKAQEFQTGQTQNQISQQSAFNNKLMLGGPGSAKTPAAIITKNYELQQSAPAAISDNLSAQKNLEATRQRLWAAGQAGSDPNSNKYFQPDGFTLRSKHKPGSSDQNVSDYFKQLDVAQKIQQKSNDIYSKNVQRVSAQYPEFQDFVSELNADAGNRANPYAVSDAPYINAKIDGRVEAMIQNNDMAGATKWSQIKNELGYGAFGSVGASAPKPTPQVGGFLTPSNGGSATNQNAWQ